MQKRAVLSGRLSLCSLLHRFTRKSYLSMGSPKIFNFWGERRHKSPNVASDILCDLVAERESPPSPCKKKCEIVLQFQGPLTRWGEILVFRSFHSRNLACFDCHYLYSIIYAAATTSTPHSL